MQIQAIHSLVLPVRSNILATFFKRISTFQILIILIIKKILSSNVQEKALLNLKLAIWDKPMDHCFPIEEFYRQMTWVGAIQQTGVSYDSMCDDLVYVFLFLRNKAGIKSKSS